MDHTSLEIVRSLFPITDDYIEECQFSRLHKLILGLTSYDLVKELANCGTASTIDTPDSQGRTPLM